MKTYEKYKPSGIEWIGCIPEHWHSVSLKWISKIYSGGTPSKNIPEYWANGTIPWLNSGSVNQTLITEPDEYISEEGFKSSSAKWIPPFSLVIALAGQGKTKGMVAQVQFETTCNQSLGVIVPNKNINNKYLLYWLGKNYQNIRHLGGGDQRDGINLEMIGGIQIPIPSIQEQTAIANYLDRKTAEIDELIADKKRLLELYEEEKTAIINQAVTKGINPDVPMKDSGIEWLGEIPEHWQVSSLKWISKIYSGGTPSKDKPEFWNNGTIPWLNSGSVNQFFIKEPSEYITEEALQKSSTKWIPSESIVIALAGQGKTKGMAAQVMLECTCNQSMGVIIPNEKVDNKYLLYYLVRNYQNIRNLGGGDKRDGINLEMVGSIKVPLFSKEEQCNIVQFIEDKFKKIDSTISKTQKLIDLLTEYRTALISDVVTGKVKVTD